MVMSQETLCQFVSLMVSLLTKKFSIGDLVMVINPETTGFHYGEIGLVTSVERMSTNHFIYWVLFGKEKKDVPMWDVEIKKLS